MTGRSPKIANLSCAALIILVAGAFIASPDVFAEIITQYSSAATVLAIGAICATVAMVLEENRSVTMRPEVTGWKKLLEGDSFDENAEMEYSVKEIDLADFEEKLEWTNYPVYLKNEIRLLFSNLRKKPVKELLGPLSGEIDRIATQSGKRVNFELEGVDVKVDAHRIRNVIRLIPQLLGNAIDHGIETPSERGSKPEYGRLRLSISDAKDQIVISVEDDGRGIDLDAVTQKAIALGYVTEESAIRLNPLQKARLILMQNLSTISELGRKGNGLADLEEAVHSAGGKIVIDSVAGRGCTIRILLPVTPVKFDTVGPAKKSA